MTEASLPPPEMLLAHAGWMRALARRLIGDAEADDLVQESWRAALEARRSGGAVRSPRAWLAGVVHNQARVRARREQRRRAREQQVARVEGVEDERTVERAALARAVLEAVLGLDEPYRSTVVLRYYEGLSTQQIAAQTGVSNAAVRKRLSRAFEALRARLDGRHGTRGKWSAALGAWAVRTEATPSAAAVLSTGGAWMTVKVTLLAAGAAAALLAFVALQPSEPDAAEAPRAGLLAAEEETLAAPEPAALDATPTSRSAVAEEGAPPAPVTAEVKSPLAVYGTVRDTAGAPIAGARVQVHHSGDRFQIASSETDAEGRYRVQVGELPPISPHAEHRLGAWAIAEAAGFLTKFAPAHEAVDGVVAIDFELTAGHQWSGKVVDSSGEPVATGVTLHDPETGKTWNARSDTDGRYWLPLPQTELAYATASTPDHGFGVLGPVRVRARADFTAPDLVLELRASIEGQVIAQDGTPVSGIRVFALPESEETPITTAQDGNTARPARAFPPAPDSVAEYWNLTGLPWDRATTDDEGRFVLGALAPGRYRLAVDDPEEVQGVFATGDTVLLSYEGHVVVGRVVDREGLPVPDGWVSIESNMTKHFVQVHRLHGTFSTNIESGSWFVTCSAAGAVPVALPITVVPERYRYDVEVVVDFEPVSGRLELSVQDSRGGTVERWQARLSPFVEGLDWQSAPALAELDHTDGGAEVPVGPYTLTVTDSDRRQGFYFRTEMLVTVGEGEPVRQTVTLERGGRFALRIDVEDAGALDADSARIELESFSEGTKRPARSFSRDTEDGGWREGPYSLDGGRELSSLLMPGAYELSVQVPEHAPIALDFTIRPGEVVELEAPLIRE